MKKVFISSPYTIGDTAINVKIQLDMSDKLLTLNFIPYTPLLSHFQHMANPRPYEDWLKLDIEWLKVCDCVLRLPGKSSGADGEVELAKQLNIPIFYSIQELCNTKSF